jgi:Uma2 family endonuclease
MEEPHLEEERLAYWTASTVERPVPAGRVTFDEFLAWADEDTRAEWVAGEIIMPSPAAYRHQRLADFLIGVLLPFVEVHDLGVVCSAPFLMRIGATAREPDLLFVAREHLARLRATYLDGPADLAVEIVSPESRRRDREVKWAEYAAAGVAEYWIIDPDARWAEFWVLESGEYRAAWAGAAGRYEAQAVPGFWLQVEWLWQEPLPPVLTVLRALKLV